jgi:hypothetical protein
MRRSIVSLPLLFALAAVAMVWLLGVTGSAGAAPRSAHIVCPASSTASPPTCCPLPPSPAGGQSAHIVCCPPTAGGTSQPQPICCGTAPCCTGGTTCCTGGTTCCPSSGSPTCCTAPCGPGSVTIAASPNPSLAGQKVVISGAVIGSSGTQVVLWRELAGQSSFQQAGQATTDSSGQYKFTLPRGKVMADQQWYVTSGAVQSPTLQQHVEALVGLTSSAVSAKAGRSIVLRGHVTPSHAGEVVLVEMSRGGVWHVIARPRLGRGSSYTISHRFAQAGALKLRVVLGADHRNDRSVSRTITVKVTR